MNATFLGQVKELCISSWAAVLFFAVYLVLGLGIYKDYGIYYDDHWARENGVVNAKYIAEKTAPGFFQPEKYCPECSKLEEYFDADHGPIFELIPTFLEWLTGIKDLQAVFQLRHLCVFLLFYCSSICFFFLLKKRFNHTLWSLAGVTLLLASPRIFAESFYNSKDLPFLSLSIFSTFTLIRFLEKPGLKTLLMHALVCGLAIDIRLLGLIFPLLTVVFSITDLRFFRRPGKPVKLTIAYLALYFAFLVGYIIAFWPYLWNKPFIKFPEILARTSSYPWTMKMLYLGKAIPASDLPWHYFPVWFLITTPVMYTVLFVAGLGFIVKDLIKAGWQFYKDHAGQLDLIITALVFLPSVGVMLFKLVLYDSWRHLYFIYPAFIYLVLLGVYSIFNSLKNFAAPQPAKLFRSLFIVVCFSFTGHTIYWMIKNHPHQNVYFSIYNNDDVRQQFELDYWGLAYKQGLEYILTNNKKPEIKVFSPALPGRTNQFSITPAERQRLLYVDSLYKADYFISAYRWHPEDFQIRKEVHQIKVDNIKILSVFELDRKYFEHPKNSF
jgi:hypothetical protein